MRMRRVARFGQWLMRSTRCVFLICASVTSNSACAQGMHDWGMWFGTVLIIGVAALLVAVLIALIRLLKR